MKNTYLNKFMYDPESACSSSVEFSMQATENLPQGLNLQMIIRDFPI